MGERPAEEGPFLQDVESFTGVDVSCSVSLLMSCISFSCSGTDPEGMF